jgi:hypothetical protein
MILNSKQLEELESIHDSVAEFEEDTTSTENDTFDESTESTLAWRRGMIEKAAANVKKAHRKVIDPQAPYTLGSLLFDRAAKRFARVEASSPGVLEVLYLIGGTASIRQNQNHLAFEEFSEGHASDSAAKSTPKAPAKTKLNPQETVKTESIEVQSIKAVESLATKKASNTKKKFVNSKKVETKPAQKLATKIAEKSTIKKTVKPTLKTVTKTKTPQKMAKPALKKIGEKTAEKKKTLAKSHKPAGKLAKKNDKQKASSYGNKLAISDPVADPNGYIKQYFRLMSNKELASITGLSEHTIRRKLGEWGLKRTGRTK